MNADRHYAVASILFDYVKSPSLRHLREPHNVHKVSREIVKALDGASSVWKKWESQREEVAQAAAPCWIPIEDLQAFLNTLSGPPLTKTDVEQRLRAIWEEPHTNYPKDELRNGCVALYQSEKADGTEMRAIIGALQEHSSTRKAGLDTSRSKIIGAGERKNGSSCNSGFSRVRIVGGRKSRTPKRSIVAAMAVRSASHRAKTSVGPCIVLARLTTRASCSAPIKVAVMRTRR